MHADTHPQTDPMPGEYPVLRLHRGTAIVLWEQDDGTRTRLVEIDRVKPDPDGYYSIGAYHWSWSHATGTSPVSATTQRRSAPRRRRRHGARNRRHQP